MTGEMTTDSKGRTILATPVLPSLGGVGVEQRAARTLAALAARGPVDLIVCRESWRDRALPRVAGAASIARGPRLDPMPGELVLRRAALRWPRSIGVARSTEVADGWLPRAPAPAVSAPAVADDRRAALPFHAFRLAAADALPRTSGRKDLDLDDLESEVARQIAARATESGDHAVASFYAALAERLVALEASRVRRYDRVYVGSAADAAWLEEKRLGVEVRVLPNVVDCPYPAVPARARSGGRARLLFVGALAYYPNVDALRVLLDEVLPALPRDRFELHVVGRGAPPWLAARLARARGVVHHGFVPTLAPLYAAADMVVAPLRAGGGTRIKLLEAFAHGVPVVTTSVGAFGLDVRDGVEVRIADRAEVFASACADLAASPGAAATLARQAFDRVRAHHRPEHFATALAAL